MTPQEKAALTGIVNSYFHYHHGIKIQSAFAEYTKNRRELLEGTSVFDTNIDYAEVTRKNIEYRKEYEKVEDSEYDAFMQLKSAILKLSNPEV